MSCAAPTSGIGADNPLRYRGYYYDTELKLYYLQSRYYDPETGRFISADSLLVAGDSINGTNMFAYCCNNPVCYYDPSGTEEEGVLQLPASSSTGSLLVGLVLGLSIGVVVLGLKVCRILYRICGTGRFKT